MAEAALIDGGDDKSCDLLYIDPEARLLLLAQGYEAQNTDRSAAPGAKAKGLHESVTWILSHDLAKVPMRIRPAVAAARQAIRDGEIGEIRLWLVHNLPESKNIEDSLTGVETACQDTLASRYPDLRIDVRAEEVGRNTLASWYHTSQVPIAVGDEFDAGVDSCLIERGPNWTSYSVTVPADWLQAKYWTYRERLFSANVRGFLGKQKRINLDMRRTLDNAPYNFWIFNNGVTALVHDATYDEDAKRLSVKGLSIVNGAQTTGALGETEDPEKLKIARIPMRFIVCHDDGTVRDIIKFTNRQNPTVAADFRSNDQVQRRLVAEFADGGITGYTGGRRTVEPRRKSDLDVETTSAAKALAAFHGYPGIAQRLPNRIWEDEALYRRLFSSATTARHVLFCWALMRALGDRRVELLRRPLDELPKGKKKQREFFDRPGSIPLMVTAVGDCLGDLLDRDVTHSYRLEFRSRVSAAEAISAWRPTVETLTPLALDGLGPILDAGLPREFDGNEHLAHWRGLVQSMTGAWDDLRQSLRDQIVGWR